MLGRADLDTLLAERDQLNENLRKIIDDQTEPWGIKVTTVEIKDVEFPETMQRAIARQAEAERERRAKIINAQGEAQAAENLYDAAETLSRSPTAIQLRYLQTLLELGSDQRSTIVFPIPLDLIQPILNTLNRQPGTPTQRPTITVSPATQAHDADTERPYTCSHDCDQIQILVSSTARRPRTIYPSWWTIPVR